MAPQKHSLLITSMGSLVGQNIMELLQGRRHTFHVAGLNTESDNAVIFQSDEIWKCPPSAADAYPDFLIRIIENCNRILCCRGGTVMWASYLRSEISILSGQICFR